MMHAQVSFIEGQFSLIHIPLPLYFALLQPILQTLLPPGSPVPGSSNPNNEPDQLLEGLSLEKKHGFLNISVTPIECSVVCHVSWAKNVFEPAIAHLPKDAVEHVSISKDTYMVFSVSSAGIEASQRVMDLTAPLALAGIPIFFITTYYTDFILVPTKDRQTVGQVLLARGFTFSEDDSAYVTTATSPIVISPSSSGKSSHSRGPSAASSTTAAQQQPPRTPPPSDVNELQSRTFTQLKKRNVVPLVEPGLHLVQCSGKGVVRRNGYSSPPASNGHDGYHPDPSLENAWLDNIDPKLYVGLVSALARQPRFLSLTLAQDDAPSLLLDKSLLWLFGNSVAGDINGDLVPIFLDLVDLPLESTGIVCGVAGRLVDEMKQMNGGGDGPVEDATAAELSYLSTARAGAVIMSAEESGRALEALGPLLGRSCTGE